MTMIRCVSPVDGEVYASARQCRWRWRGRPWHMRASRRKAWARRPLDERVKLVLAGVARLNEMVDEVVPELACRWPAGAPMAASSRDSTSLQLRRFDRGRCAEAARRGGERSLRAAHRARAAWRRLRHRSVELSLYDRESNTVGAGADGRQYRDPQARQQTSSSAAHGARLSRRAFRRTFSQNLFLDHDTTAALIAAKSFDFINFTGSVEAAGRSSGGAAPLPASASSSAARILAMWMERCRPRRGRRHADGRRDLQFRPVLLRHERIMCMSRSMTPLREIGRLASNYKLGNRSIRRRRSSDGKQALCGNRAQSSRRCDLQGCQGADRPEALPAGRWRCLSGAASPCRRRSLHGVQS